MLMSLTLVECICTSSVDNRKVKNEDTHYSRRRFSEMKISGCAFHHEINIEKSPYTFTKFEFRTRI